MGVQWTEVGRSKCEGTFVFYTRCENSEKRALIDDECTNQGADKLAKDSVNMIQ